MFGGIERSIKSILSDIVGNVQHIVRSEVRLARAEAVEQLQATVRSVAVLAAGAVVVVLALAMLLLACVYLLALVVPPWAAALIVASVTGASGGVLVMAGLKRMRQITPGLPKTATSIQETIEWAKSAAK